MSIQKSNRAIAEIGHEGVKALRPAYDEGLFQQLIGQRSMFWRPAYHDTGSAWSEHMPFAFWIIEAHRPRVLVELGTHRGGSYFAFCQAVERLGLDTRCFAVDTWKGNEHAGFSDESMFEMAKAHNEAHFSGFSRLVRSTFDAAVNHFEDDSIDLLHIDGLHTFEAASHDSGKWLTKLSERAVVMLHETNMRGFNQVAARLFDSLRNKYSAFEFIHGHGLCVFKVGPRQTDQMLRLFQSAKEEQIRPAVQEVFSRLGRACADYFTLAQQKGHTSDLKNMVDKQQKQLEGVHRILEKTKAALNERNEELSDTIANLQTQIKQLVLEKGQLLERNTLLRENYTELKQELTRLQDRLEESLMGISQRNEKLAHLEQAILENKQQLRTATNELEERECTIVSLRDDIAARTVENHSLNDKLSDSAGEINNLNQVLAESRKSLTSIQYSHQKQHEEIARLQEERNGHLEEIGRQQWYLGERDAEIERLQWYLGERDAEITQMKETLLIKEQKLDQVQSNWVERNETVERLGQELETHKTDLMARQEETLTLRKQLEERSSVSLRLEEEFKNRERELAEAYDKQAKVSSERRAQLENLQQALRAQESANKENVRENELLALKLRQVQEELETVLLEKQRLAQVKQKLEVAHKDAIQKEEQARNYTSELKKQLEERLSASLRLEEEFNDRQRKLTEASNKQAKVSSERQAQLEQVQKALRTQEAVNKDNLQENELLLLQLHQVQEELELIFLQKQRLEQVNQNLKVANKDATHKGEQLRHYTWKCQELQRQLLAKDSKIESQDQHIAKLKKTVSWRITTPLRLIARPFKRPDKTQTKLKKEIRLIKKSGVFDGAWYLAEYEDVAKSGMDPIEHFLCHGASEGRCPSSTFDTQFYLESNPDVAAAGENPLVHFIKTGKREGRKTLDKEDIVNAPELSIITENQAA